MNGKNWQELDYKVASDYTFGGPEYYRTKLRKMLNIPTLLPGEKNDISAERHIKTDTPEVSVRGHMSGFFHKGKG